VLFRAATGRVRPDEQLLANNYYVKMAVGRDYRDVAPRAVCIAATRAAPACACASSPESEDEPRRATPELVVTLRYTLREF
jgi:hypothetical protein